MTWCNYSLRNFRGSIVSVDLSLCITVNLPVRSPRPHGARIELKRWRNFSIAHKLYLVIGTMAVLIACELLTLRFAMHTLSVVRAFVEGEGNWSKSQKDAAFSLQRYALTGNEMEYES